MLMASAAGLLPAADPPEAEITNGQMRIKVYLPDAAIGFYRSTRFDWSGVIYSLEYKGHNYYGPWFQKIDPKVHDVGYDASGVVSTPCTAMVGPGEEYLTAGMALGYDEAKPGGTFIKIGVGVLRKVDDSRYDHSKAYDIVDGGQWKVEKGRDYIQFTQELADPGTQYGYEYQKTLRLTKGAPQMVLEHKIKNTGSRPIETSMYNHNFLVLDRQAPGPDFTITVPFQMEASRPPDEKLGEIRGNQILYRQTLENEERMAATVSGFGATAKDNDIRVENRKVGAGVRITGDHPLSNLSLWSIRTVLAIEPYITMTIAPGAEFNWKITYDYYILPAAAK
jgi:hypothetical protein